MSDNRVQHADDVREIRLVLTARELVLIRRSLTIASELGDWDEAEMDLLEELDTSFSMVVRTDV